MVKVRCPKCGTIFPPEARDIQICPNCGCVMRVKRRAARRYDHREDAYEVRQPRLAERSSGVYLSRDEYENLLRSARTRRNGSDDRYRRDGAVEDYGGDMPEYDAPGDLYDCRREPDADRPDAQETHADEAQGRAADVSAVCSPAQTSYMPVPAPQPPSAGLRYSTLAMVVSSALAIAAGAMSVLLLVFGVIGSGLHFSEQLVALISEGNALQKTVMLLMTILPAVFALIALIGSLTHKKGLMIVFGVLLLIACVATVFIVPIYELVGGAAFGTATVDALASQNAWVYITAGLEFVSAFALFVSAAKTKKIRK